MKQVGAVQCVIVKDELESNLEEFLRKNVSGYEGKRSFESAVIETV